MYSFCVNLKQFVLYLKQGQTMSQLFKNNGEQIKMIDFVKYLYKKHKVLNKLSEKQSRDFQAQIVNLLVDSDQNVDRETFEDIASNIGFEVFILETLGNVINRTPFKNQYQLNRNLDTIAENIRKEQEQLQKRQKILERREEKVKLTEQQVLATCKHKLIAMEAEIIKKITAKQAQVKKSITILLNQLKAKQKLMLERYEASKLNKQTLAQIQQRQKGLNQRLKQLDRRQRELKSKDIQQSMYRKDSRMNEIQQQNNRLRQAIGQLNSKLKNMELAYRKVKGQNEKLVNEKKKQKVQSETKNQSSQKRLQKPNTKKTKEFLKIELEDLQLSIIESKTEVPIKHPKIKQVLQASSNAKQTQGELKIDHLVDHSELQESSLSFLQEEQQSNDPHESLINQINSITLSDVASKEKLLSSGRLLKLFEQAASLRYPLSACIELLEMMLPLMEIDEANATVAAYLKQQIIIDSIQRMYLCHETSSDVAESSTLILSRVKIWNGELKLQQAFRKALQIRKRVESQNTILCLNIKNLLQ